MRRPALRGAVPAALAALVLALVAGLAGYLTAGSESHRGATAPTGKQPAAVRGVVRSFAGTTLSLTTESGSVDINVAQSTPVEVLRPTTLAQITAGDWLNAGAFENQQTMFTLAGLVVIPQTQLAKPR